MSKKTKSNKILSLDEVDLLALRIDQNRATEAEKKRFQEHVGEFSKEVDEALKPIYEKYGLQVVPELPAPPRLSVRLYSKGADTEKKSEVEVKK